MWVIPCWFNVSFFHFISEFFRICAFVGRPEIQHLTHCFGFEVLTISLLFCARCVRLSRAFDARRTTFFSIYFRYQSQLHPAGHPNRSTLHFETVKTLIPVARSIIIIVICFHNKTIANASARPQSHSRWRQRTQDKNRRRKNYGKYLCLFHFVAVGVQHRQSHPNAKNNYINILIDIRIRKPRSEEKKKKKMLPAIWIVAADRRPKRQWISFFCVAVCALRCVASLCTQKEKKMRQWHFNREIEASSVMWNTFGVCVVRVPVHRLKSPPKQTTEQRRLLCDDKTTGWTACRSRAIEMNLSSDIGCYEETPRKFVM